MLENYLFGAPLFPCNTTLSQRFSFAVSTAPVFKTVIAFLNWDEIVVGMNYKTPKKTYEVALFNLATGLKVGNNLLQGEGKVTSIGCAMKDQIVVVINMGVHVITEINRKGLSGQCDLLVPLLKKPEIASKTTQIAFLGDRVYSVQEDGLRLIFGKEINELKKPRYIEGGKIYWKIKQLALQSHTQTVLTYYKKDIDITSLDGTISLPLSETCTALALDRLDIIAVAFKNKVCLYRQKEISCTVEGDFKAISSILLHPSGVIVIGDGNMISIFK